MPPATTTSIITRHDYLPFGDEIPAGSAGRSSQFGAGADNVNQKFTGQYRDPETLNDEFPARYYTAPLMRFLAPDPAGPAAVDPTDPQTWNQYAYVRNNPLDYTDPTGMCSYGDPSCPPFTFHATGRACNWWNIFCWLPSGPGTSPAAPWEYDASNAGDSNSGGNPGPPPQNAGGGAAAPNSGTPAQKPLACQINSRAVNIPGGQFLHLIGANHEWITTSTGVSVGMGTAQGVPQSDYPGVQTQVVNHTGQVPTSFVTFNNIDPAALNTYIKLGTPTGPWIPDVNDCNTWANQAINNSTPHNITVGIYGVPITIATGVVVYADGTIHAPGGY